MNILIVGATGFIGSRLADALADAGHQVRRASRHAPSRPGYARLDFTRLSRQDLRTAVEGCDVVVNAVGILREHGRQTFDALHSQGPCELFAACAAAGVARVIQISALGAEAGALSRYHRSKHEADRELMELPLDWSIVQPSLVYGPGGTSARLFGLLASLPLTPLPAAGRQEVQPVHIDDLVAAVLRLVESPVALRCVLPVVGPEPLTLRDFLAKLRAALGERPTPALSIPRPLMKFGAALAHLLPGALLDADTLAMLERGNTGDPSALRRWLGRDPRPVERFVPAPATGVHRREAALTWLLPLLRVGVAAMWFIAAIVSLGPYPVSQSLALLTSIGAPDGFAPLLLAGAVLCDFTLGVLSLWPKRPRWLWPAQIGLVLLYTAIISWKLPGLWLEPFGPVAKNIPILALLLLLNQLDRRP